ncbi:hypothetical protein [Vogesella indigofera]|uniref:hypothetical protein n=1 Tax=Vogesella indigofera TaxID=45465 RepID=UPI00234E972C|nr:hypothetical protein [Vogesella indigofera]MDC7698315.1 hypothetical protein [Vogesella indigofera]
MDQSITDLKQQRLQKLFADCQQQVISQIIGPFGLSAAMFEDRNGGNVTTMRNFSRDDTDYIADKDQSSYEQSRKDYDREEYSDPAFAKKSQEYRAKGKDGYTGKDVAPEDMDLDHVTSLKTISKNKKVHLALETGESLDRIKEMANSDENLVATHKSINRSKRDGSLDELAERKGEDYELNLELVAQAKKQSEEHIASTVNTALMKKQGMELLQTGGTQAAMMGMRQALGLLLTELVNGLFNEFKVLIKQGVEAGKTLFEEIRQRLARVIQSVAKKIPDAVGQMFQGGVSGFMSNLLTFLINNFLSTTKRFVTVIREGLLGLLRAFKMIFFPPKHMTDDQALQEGLKMLTAVVVTSVGLLLNETVATFMATVPFIKPFADLITPVLIGIMTGLLSAFLAYQIDSLFDRYRHSHNERLLDELIADAKRRDEFANELVTLSETSLSNIENYSKSITLYQSIGVTLSSAGLAASATLASLEKTVAETGEHVAKSFAMIDFINESQSEIEDFLKTL